MDHADSDLDRRLDHELTRLPRPRAPESLLPRVIAATARRPAATGWFTWPKGWRVASVAVMTALVAVAVWLLGAPPEPVSGMAQSAGQAATIVRTWVSKDA